MPTPAPTPERGALLRAGVRLEVFTVAWNVVEGVVGVSAALAAGSVALLGFGVDSFVESASGLVLLWRLTAEARGASPGRVGAVERRAERLVAASLMLLAAYVAADAAATLWRREVPAASPVGIGLTTLSLLVMGWLARAKRRVAAGLGSGALRADAFQTLACLWLSAVTLAGLTLNAALGWWWADPVAALGLAGLIVREAREAWEGDE